MSSVDARLLQQAALSAAGPQQHPVGALYVVATPIGNVADISLRAIHVLNLVDAIACEDTRHSAPLLRLLGIDGKPLLALHAHNEREASGGVLLRLEQGERVALISDAGTPAVSDPGALLVSAVRAAGHRVVPIPGASSTVAAVSVAGDAIGGGFVFVGFLPAKGGERATALRRVADCVSTQVLFEAPHRIQSLATDLGAACAGRTLTVCRELTKQFESVETLPADRFADWLAADANRVRGEFVLVVHARVEDVANTTTELDRTLRVLLAAMPLKQAVGLAAELTGAPRNALYERALQWKNDDGAAPGV